MDRCAFTARFTVLTCFVMFSLAARGQVMFPSDVQRDGFGANFPDPRMARTMPRDGIGGGDPFDGPFTIAREPQATAPETVSIDRLKHPLSGKAMRLIDRALKLSRRGDHAAAVAALKDTFAKQPASEPYVRSLLGIEYMKMAQIPLAAIELERAVALFPHEAANHSNFALSLYDLRQYDRAEVEVRKALELDANSKPAKMILQAVLERQKARSSPAPIRDAQDSAATAAWGQ